MSEKELNRNNAVYSFQYNRNPFIDYPQMAEYIWGDSTEYAFNFDGGAVAAPSISLKSGDVITFDGVIGDVVATKQYKITGRNITSPLHLIVEDTHNFEVTPTTIDAADVTSAQGAVIDIIYHPQTQGIHNASLFIVCDNLPDDVEVILKGVCMPDIPNFVKIEGLKSCYSRSDEDVLLTLSNYTRPVTWFIDDIAIGDNILSPSTLLPGSHKITFKNDSLCGDVRITIIE